MGILSNLFKKETKFNPSTEYFIDILDDAKRIKISNSQHGDVLGAYYNTPQLSSIINYSAKVASRNDLRFYNKQGEETENVILTLFENPHPLYSEGEFWETFFKQLDLFQIVLTYKVSGGQKVSGLYVLPFQIINIVPVKDLKPLDILLAQDISEVISHYELQYNNKKYIIPVEDVWILSGTSLRFDKDGYLEPDNPINTSLQYPIKNIQSNYQARYSLIENRGQLGVWVNNQTDSGAYVPLQDDEKKDVRETLRRTFGMTKGRDLIGFTNANLKFETASLPVKDMQFSQGIQQDKITLCDAFNFPILLLNDLAGSTYSNLDIADRNLYTKKTIPTWEIVSKSITREFKLDGYVEFYTGDIEVLKKDDKVQAETNKINTGLVISLNTAVKKGNMTTENAIQTLVLIADVSKEIAKEVIIEYEKPDQDNQLNQNGQGNEQL